MDISYCGARYSGWQIQPNGATVQEEIEKGLSLILKEDVSVVGGGRTDTGVHAKQQIAHFETSRWFEVKDLSYKLNSFLSKDIGINKIRSVSNDAHARFSAIKRTYCYHLNQHKNPFAQDTSYYFNSQINVPIINKACEIIKGWQNFECFSKVHTEVDNFNCEIFEVKWSQNGGEHLFIVAANRFLRGMVRAMVGTLLDLGTEKASLEKFKKILASGDRKKAGRTVPAHGLFLQKVEYPQELFN